VVQPDLDPITGPAPSTLTTSLLAERLAAERSLREQSEKFLAEDFDEFKTEIQRRLGELNHAHAAAVEAQARTVPREMFDQFVKENDSRREAAFSALGNRLEASIDSLKATVDVGHEALGKEIEIERNARIRAEGSVAVWRFIAVFLGFPGVIALILAAIALFGPKT
jgi:16S rRNA C967 or C1407 C5-methylase (RsmB/RsmF family)